ncbi:hypothetical protein [Campylobacter fetus]|uniref:hypothetical protein n=2 Tax=Campylobacter fetus TaxID=196 RepID=UPI00073A827C|nr:hypothetical protein [Campylobacter fetus]ALV65019.1 hypothetical membrane protein [Campylobacter fetus subsp. testudinum Sp3]OCR85820.1 hypothetical protein CFT12S05168_02345 [Campylobacter fetus subsp. testudinum]
MFNTVMNWLLSLSWVSDFQLIDFLIKTNKNDELIEFMTTTYYDKISTYLLYSIVLSLLLTIAIKLLLYKKYNLHLGTYKNLYVFFTLLLISFFWAESLLIFIFLSIFIGIYYLIINDIEECKDKFILFSYTALSSFLLIFLVYSFTTVAL